MTSKPTIGIFLPRLSLYGGVEQVAWRLAQGLAEGGYAVEMVCARQETDPPAGVTVEVVGRFGLTKFGKILWFMLAVERVRKRKGYDLTIGLGKTLKQDLLRKSGGPEETFWQLHKRMYPPALMPFKKLKRALLEPQRPLKEWIERRQFKDARLVVAVSHICKDWMLQRYPELDKKLVVVYNKPDLSQFSVPTPERREELRREWGIPPAQKAVLFAGAHNFRLKGLPTCIQAMTHLPKEYVLLVAGGKRPEPFQRQAQRLGVDDRVRFLGRVENVMPGLYSAADVLALPTLYDTCTNVVLEAMASGLPAVASPDDGSSYFAPPDLVLVDPQNPAELAGKIQLAVSRPMEPLVWPEDIPAGIEPYLGIVQRLLAEKNQA